MPSHLLGASLEPPLEHSQFRIAWKKGFFEDCQCGKSNLFRNKGSLTLIRSTLSNSSIYVMSLFNIPKMIRLRFEKILRYLVCRDKALEKKMYLGKWSIVCKEKSKTGLSIRCLSSLNKALLGKWCWGYASKGETF